MIFNNQYAPERTIIYTTRTNIFTYHILISSCVGGAEEGPPMYKMRACFLNIPLPLSVPIFNKKSHRTLAMETFIIWSKLESFHSSYPMRFFVENWYTKSQGHKKNCPHFICKRVRSFPSTQLAIGVVLLHKRGDR